MTSDVVIISGVGSIVLLGDADVHISWVRKCHGGVSSEVAFKQIVNMFELAQQQSKWRTQNIKFNFSKFFSFSFFLLYVEHDN